LPTIRLAPHLKTTLEAKEVQMQKAIINCLVQLQKSQPGPFPRGTKKMQGAPGVFESRASRGDRLTWEWDNGVIVILNHCNHDILRRARG
jgi:hypothetical protein